MKMRKISATLIGICLLVVLCSCQSSNNATATNENSMSWQEQYDLGMRYLTDGNYEEAIIAFTAAIEIDPKQAASFSGRAEAYTRIAEQSGDTAVASEYYTKALNDYEEAVRLGDASSREKADELRELLSRISALAEFDTLLEPLYLALRQNDMDTAKSLMRMEEYQLISSSVMDTPVLYEGDGEYVLAVYRDNFYYFGEWLNDQRSGNGRWYKAVFDGDVDIYMYQGEWANDLPNGSGEIVRQRDATKVQVEAGHITSIRREICGSFSDGLYDGIINIVEYESNGETHIWENIISVDGIYQPMTDVPNEVMALEGYYDKNIAQGMYLVASTYEGGSRSDLWDRGNVNFVAGVLN